MPPDGFTTITITDDFPAKLAQSMSHHECDSYSEAVEYAVTATLAQEDELSSKDLVEMVADRVA